MRIRLLESYPQQGINQDEPTECPVAMVKERLEKLNSDNYGGHLGLVLEKIEHSFETNIKCMRK